MILSPNKTTVAYRCPVCCSHVTAPVGVFSLSGEYKVLRCPCGGSEMKIANTGDGKVRLSVPCILCPHDHIYVLNAETFYERDLFVINCAISDIGACFLGDPEKVEKAMEESDSILCDMVLGEEDEEEDKEEKEDPDYVSRLNNLRNTETSSNGGYFESGSTLFDMCNFMLHELIEDDCIECRCEHGKGRYGFELLDDEDDSARFFCDECGASAVYPASELFYSDGRFKTEKIYLF